MSFKGDYYLEVPFVGDFLPAPPMKQPASPLTGIVKLLSSTGIRMVNSSGGSTLFSLRLPNNICSFSTPITFANGSAFDMQLAILSVCYRERRQSREERVDNETSKYVTPR